MAFQIKQYEITNTLQFQKCYDFVVILNISEILQKYIFFETNYLKNMCCDIIILSENR